MRWRSHVACLTCVRMCTPPPQMGSSDWSAVTGDDITWVNQLELLQMHESGEIYAGAVRTWARVCGGRACGCACGCSQLGGGASLKRGGGVIESCRLPCCSAWSKGSARKKLKLKRGRSRTHMACHTRWSHTLWSHTLWRHLKRALPVARAVMVAVVFEWKCSIWWMSCCLWRCVPCTTHDMMAQRTPTLCGPYTSRGLLFRHSRFVFHFLCGSFFSSMHTPTPP